MPNKNSKLSQCLKLAASRVECHLVKWQEKFINTGIAMEAILKLECFDFIFISYLNHTKNII